MGDRKQAFVLLHDLPAVGGAVNVQIRCDQEPDFDLLRHALSMQAVSQLHAVIADPFKATAMAVAKMRFITVMFRLDQPMLP